MDPVMDLLLSRASVKEVGEPGPGDEELKLVFEAAVRAPDHGKLRPWRFFLIRGDAREKLSNMFAEGVRRREPAAPPALVQKEREKPLRSPVTIAVAAKIVPGHKIPEIEQTLSAAAAAMNMLNALHALGYGARWVTGANCYDPEFRKEFGLEEADRLIGFIHVGTPKERGPAMARPDPDEFVIEWGR
jgi:nitroreductase